MLLIEIEWACIAKIPKGGQFYTPGDTHETYKVAMTSKKSGPGSGLDRSPSAAFAFFSRRHSASLNLRRSVSSVSSRRHSSPISQEAANATTSTSDTEDSPEVANHRTSFPRSLRWRLLARKVLGNVEEEPRNNSSLEGNLRAQCTLLLLLLCIIAVDSRYMTPFCWQRPNKAARFTDFAIRRLNHSTIDYCFTEWNR